MTTLTITAKGQLTLKKDILRHIGVEPGQQVDVDILPNGRVSLCAARPAGDISGFIGLLAGKSERQSPVSIEEMNDVIAEGWGTPS